MPDPFTPEQLHHLHTLWRSIIHERRYPLLGRWLVIVVDDWFVTLEIAQRWVVGRANRFSPHAVWFAGRLEDTP